MLSPLEQFQILPIFSLQLFQVDFSVTNSTLIGGLMVGFLFFLFHTMGQQGVLYVIPTRWQLFVEKVYAMILTMVTDNLGEKGTKYFPFLFFLFLFLLGGNLIGMVPYSFTITSHIIVTFGLALGVFVGANIICLREHGVQILTLFLPGGTAFPLAFLLVPIEVVSYIFKPISLGVRLFCNMMAGHTLLKVIAGFVWTMATAGGMLFVTHFAPLFVLFLLMGIEIGVGCIQAYVFTLLCCIYLNDALNLH
jgi:ATP synthase subunit 6